MKNAFVSLSKAMFLGYVRDKAALFFTILFPIVFLILIGSISQDSGTAKIKVLEVGPVEVFDHVPETGSHDFNQVMAISKEKNLDDALNKVRKGDVDAAIEQRDSVVMVHYSAADPVKAGSVRGTVESVVQQVNEAAHPQPNQISLQSSQVEDKSLKTIQVMTPGLLGWAIATSATFGAALTLVTWRQKKILRRIRLSPVPISTVISSRVGVSVAVALLQTALFIGVATLPAFGLQLDGNWWMAIPLVLCGTLAFLSIGLIAGAWAKTTDTASVVVNLLVIPMAFLSGSFFPIDDAPSWLKTVSQIFPLRHLVDGMKDVMVRGEGWSAALPQMGILLGFAAVVSLIATRIFRWEDA